jgi:hypothetical protein
LRYLTKLRVNHGKFDPILQEYALALFPRWGGRAEDYERALQKGVEAFSSDPQLKEMVFATAVYTYHERGKITHGIKIQMDRSMVSWRPCLGASLQHIGFYDASQLLERLENWPDPFRVSTALLFLDSEVGDQLFADAKATQSPAGRGLFDLFRKGFAAK